MDSVSNLNSHGKDFSQSVRKKHNVVRGGSAGRDINQTKGRGVLSEQKAKTFAGGHQKARKCTMVQITHVNQRDLFRNVQDILTSKNRIEEIKNLTAISKSIRDFRNTKILGEKLVGLIENCRYQSCTDIGKQKEALIYAINQLKDNIKAKENSILNALKVIVFIEKTYFALNAKAKSNTTIFSFFRCNIDEVYKSVLIDFLYTMKNIANSGFEKDYFDIFNKILNKFSYYPFNKRPSADGIKGEIVLVINKMIESEVNYLNYAGCFKRGIDSISYYKKTMQWFLGFDKPRSAALLKYDIISEQDQKTLSQKICMIDNFKNRKLTDTDELIKNDDLLGALHKIDGSLQEYPFQVRLISSILKNELDKVAEFDKNNVSFFQDLSILQGLYGFYLQYSILEKVGSYLFEDLKRVMSAVVARMLKRNDDEWVKIGNKEEIENIIESLVANKIVSDFCVSLWRNYKRIETTSENITGFDGFVAIEKLNELLDSRCEDDLVIKASIKENRWWFENKALAAKMDNGEELFKKIDHARHTIYIRFFSDLFAFFKKMEGKNIIDKVEMISDKKAKIKGLSDILFVLQDDKQRQIFKKRTYMAWEKSINSMISDIGIAVTNDNIKDFLCIKEVLPANLNSVFSKKIREFIGLCFSSNSASTLMPSNIIELSSFSLGFMKAYDNENYQQWSERLLGFWRTVDEDIFFKIEQEVMCLSNVDVTLKFFENPTSDVEKLLNFHMISYAMMTVFSNRDAVLQRILKAGRESKMTVIDFKAYISSDPVAFLSKFGISFKNDKLIYIPKAESHLEPRETKVHTDSEPYQHIGSGIVELVGESLSSNLNQDDRAVALVQQYDQAVVPVQQYDQAVVPVQQYDQAVVPVQQYDQAVVPVQQYDQAVVPVQQYDQAVVPVQQYGQTSYILPNAPLKLPSINTFYVSMDSTGFDNEALLHEYFTEIDQVILSLSQSFESDIRYTQIGSATLSLLNSKVVGVVECLKPLLSEGDYHRLYVAAENFSNNAAGYRIYPAFEESISDLVKYGFITDAIRLISIRDALCYMRRFIGIGYV